MNDTPGTTSGGSNREPAPSLPRVLLVEDDPCTALLYKKLLQKEGYNVEHCTDGEAALLAISKERFDAIVLDLMLPKIDGMQVLKLLRGSPDNPLVPVIIMSAARLKVVEEEAFRFGAKLFLDKTQNDKLVEGLRKIMSERSVVAGIKLRMAAPAPIEAGTRRPPATPATRSGFAFGKS